MAVSALKNVKSHPANKATKQSKLRLTKDCMPGTKVVASSSKKEDPIHVAFNGRFKITGNIVSPLDIDWGKEWDAKK